MAMCSGIGITKLGCGVQATKDLLPAIQTYRYQSTAASLTYQQFKDRQASRQREETLSELPAPPVLAVPA